MRVGPLTMLGGKVASYTPSFSSPALALLTFATKKAAGFPDGLPHFSPRAIYMCLMISSPNSEHLISVAPSINRAKS